MECSLCQYGLSYVSGTFWTINPSAAAASRALPLILPVAHWWPIELFPCIQALMAMAWIHVELASHERNWQWLVISER